MGICVFTAMVSTTTYALTMFITPSSDANKYWNSGAGLRLDSLGTGWVDYNNFDINGSSSSIAFCVNSDGSVLFGGQGTEDYQGNIRVHKEQRVCDSTSCKWQRRLLRLE